MWMKQLSSPVLIFIFILLIQHNHGSEVDSEEEAASYLLQKSLIKARMKINRHAIHRRQALYHHFVELEDNFFEENDADPDNDEDGDGRDVDQEEKIRLETRNLTSDAISDSTKTEFENAFDDEDIEESGAHRPSDDPNVAYTTLTKQNDDKSIKTGLKDGLQAKIQHPVLKRNYTTNNTKRHHKNNNQSTTVIKDSSTRHFIQSKTFESQVRENKSTQNEHDLSGKLKRNTTFPTFLPSDRRRSNSTLGTGISDSENSKTTKIQESKPMLPIHMSVKKDFLSNKTHGAKSIHPTHIDDKQVSQLTNTLKSNVQLRTDIAAINNSHLTNRSKSNAQLRTGIDDKQVSRLTNTLKSNAQLRTDINAINDSHLTNRSKSNAQLRTDIGGINGPVFGDEIIHQTSIAHAPCQPQPGCHLMLIPNTVPSHKNEEKYLLSQAHALKQNAQLMSMQADILEHEVTSIKGGSGQHVMTVDTLQGLHAHNMRLHNDYFNVDKPVHLPSGHHGHGPEHGGTEDLIHNAEHYKEGDSHNGGGSLKVEGGSKIQSIGTGYPQYNLPTKPMGGGGASGGAAGASSNGGLFEFVRPLPPAAGPNPYEVLTSATLGQDYPGVSQKQSAAAMGFNEAGGAGMQYEVLTSANLGKDLPGVTQEQSAAAMGFNNGGGGAMMISKPMKFVVSLKGLKVKEQKAQKLINFTVKRDGGKATRLHSKRKLNKTRNKRKKYRKRRKLKNLNRR